MERQMQFDEEEQETVAQSWRPAEKKCPDDYIFIKQMPLGLCTYCDREREMGNDFFPNHTASYWCQSGRYDHCTCDRCF